MDTQSGLPYQEHFSGYSVRNALPRPFQWILSQDCPTKTIYSRYSVRIAIPRLLQRVLSQNCPTKTITVDTQSGLSYQDHSYSVRIALRRPLQWIISQDFPTMTITVDTQARLPYGDHYSDYSVRTAIPRPLKWTISQDCPSKTITVISTRWVLTKIIQCPIRYFFTFLYWYVLISAQKHVLLIRNTSVGCFWWVPIICILIYFKFLNEKICYGYSLEPPNFWKKHMLWVLMRNNLLRHF